MRYALTYMTSDWNSVDTLIIKDREEKFAKLVAEERWAEYDKLLVKILQYYGLTMAMAIGVVEDKKYFMRNLDDIDVSLTDSIVDENGVERKDYFKV